MQKIKLWSVESSGSRKATAVADIDTTETEQQLEDLLVNLFLATSLGPLRRFILAPL